MQTQKGLRLHLHADIYITQLILLLTSYRAKKAQRANTEVFSQNGLLRTE